MIPHRSVPVRSWEDVYRQKADVWRHTSVSGSLWWTGLFQVAHTNANISVDNKTRCIPESFLCDGEKDCVDATDEANCCEYFFLLFFLIFFLSIF